MSKNAFKNAYSIWKFAPQIMLLTTICPFNTRLLIDLIHPVRRNVTLSPRALFMVGIYL